MEPLGSLGLEQSAFSLPYAPSQCQSQRCLSLWSTVWWSIDCPLRFCFCWYDIAAKRPDHHNSYSSPTFDCDFGIFLIKFSSRGDQTQPFSNSKHLKREERNSVSVGHSVCLSHFFFTIIKGNYICKVYSVWRPPTFAGPMCTSQGCSPHPAPRKKGLARPALRKASFAPPRRNWQKPWGATGHSWL